MSRDDMSIDNLFQSMTRCTEPTVDRVVRVAMAVHRWNKRNAITAARQLSAASEVNSAPHENGDDALFEMMPVATDVTHVGDSEMNDVRGMSTRLRDAVAEASFDARSADGAVVVGRVFVPLGATVLGHGESSVVLEGALTLTATPSEQAAVASGGSAQRVALRFSTLVPTAPRYCIGDGVGEKPRMEEEDVGEEEEASLRWCATSVVQSSSLQSHILDPHIARVYGIAIVAVTPANGVFDDDVLRSGATSNEFPVHIVRSFCVDTAVLTICAIVELGEATLQSAMAQVGLPLPVDDVLHVVQGVCCGLDALKQRGIVHGDIKPANILLVSTHKGEAPQPWTSLRKYTPKLNDFGFAHAAPGPEGLSEICRVRDPLRSALPGTPAFMSPRSCCGYVDNEADMWAVGMLIVLLALGKLPWTPLELQHPALIVARYRDARGRASQEDVDGAGPLQRDLASFAALPLSKSLKDFALACLSSQRPQPVDAQHLKL